MFFVKCVNILVYKYWRSLSLKTLFKEDTFYSNEDAFTLVHQ